MSISADELYKGAYDAHYKEYDIAKAKIDYKKVIEKYPKSPEARYAQNQLSNLARDKEKLEYKREQIIKTNTDESLPIQQRSLKEFSKYYLSNLKSNLEDFGSFFSFISFLFLIQVLISAFVALIIISKAGFTGAIQIILLAVNFAIVFKLASLGERFVKLQTQKVENDIQSTIGFRSESVKMAKEILKKAEQRAENNITVSGGNAVFAINGSTVSGVTQTITVEGDSELVKSLALLVSFCEESENSEALKMSTQLSEEATKETPNKGILFDLWSGITAALPEIAGIVKIVQGIKSLLI